MKQQFLKLENPCSEQWNTMQANSEGRFCDSCAKNVIDFTSMSPVEISLKMKQAKGKICAQISSEQLNSPLIIARQQKSWSVLPYSTIAASLLIASSLVACETHCSFHAYNRIEQVSTFGQIMNIQSNRNSVPKGTIEDVTLFSGKILHSESQQPIKNAKISFVCTQKVISGYSDEQGNFELKIESNLLDQDNVVRFSYGEVKAPLGDSITYFQGYDTKDVVYSKADFAMKQEVLAHPSIHYVGGIGRYVERKDPIVLENGVPIKYKDFAAALQGEKSVCSLENKEYLYFTGIYAMAIYGNAAKDGLYIILAK
ncbi:MAG: hypothetical protein V4638_02460 [Bacteroidota bacterium]